MKLHNFLLPFLAMIMLFLFQGCSEARDDNGTYLSGAYGSKDTKILKEEVVLHIQKDITKARYSIDYEVEILKSGELIPLVLVVQSSSNDINYKIGITFDGKSQKVLHNNLRLQDNFSSDTINYFKNPASSQFYPISYIEGNFTKGKHKIHVDFIGTAGEAREHIECSDTALYLYPDYSDDNISVKPTIEIKNESLWTKSSMSQSGKDVRIMVNAYDNFFSYIMSYIHFLVSVFIAFLLAKSHKNGSKETSSYKYVFYPLIIIFTFFYLWDTFGCMGMGIALLPVILFIVYTMYIGFVSNSIIQSLQILGIMLLFFMFLALLS
ncbi:MAG: hypothetical protein KN64_05405 [Sulfurovum sp. AS07-7]|nr:MAG: hypothetical protein KN64_05405 [Sulfurovum sp. AS07-7]